MKTSILLIPTLAAAAFVFSPSARAGAVVGATEFTQLLNNGILGEQAITQANQLAQQVQMVSNQLEAYQLMLRNIQSLPPRQWNDAVDLLSQLATLTEQARSFAYVAGNSADVFKQRHPSFARVTLDGGVTAKEYSEAYSAWDGEVQESVEKTTEAVALHFADFKPTSKRIQQLKQDSVNADGQKAAIQAGNQFAAVQAEQLVLLRQLIASQVQQQQVVIAAEQSKASANQAAREKALKKTKKFFTGKEKSY